MPFPRTPNFSMMAEKWPSAIVGRQQIEAFTGGIMTEKYLAILDSQGRGPRNRVRIGRKIAYLAKELILWLESRSEFIEADGEKIPVNNPSSFNHTKPLRGARDGTMCPDTLDEEDEP